MKLISYLLLFILVSFFSINSYSASLSKCDYKVIVKINSTNLELPKIIFSSLGKNNNADTAMKAASSAMKNCIWTYKGRVVLSQNCIIETQPSYGKGIITSSYSQEQLGFKIKDMLCENSQTQYSYDKVVIKAKNEKTRCDFIKGEFDLMNGQSGMCK